MLLDYPSSRAMLLKYKIDTPASEIFDDKQKDLALKFAKKIKFPVVLKIFGGEMLHRSEQKAVIVNISDEKEFTKAFAQLAKFKLPILAQKMVLGQQIAIGLKQDAQFGQIIMFGLGGIFIEVLKDVSFRVCPIDKTEALKMIKEIKGLAVLQGARGQVPVNLDVLAELIANISNLAQQEKNIVEADFNPIIVLGDQALAADFKFIIN